MIRLAAAISALIFFGFFLSGQARNSCIDLFVSASQNETLKPRENQKTSTRGLWEFFLHRSISEQELLTLDKVAKVSEVSKVVDLINEVPSFSPAERQLLLEDHPVVVQQFARMSFENSTIFSMGRAMRNPARLNFKEVQDLESDFKKIKSKLKFHSRFDYELFNFFRFSSALERASDLVAPMWRGQISPQVKLLNTNVWVRVIREEYSRVLFVLKNLGTTRLKEFPDQFGHLDHVENSKIFSLRLNPEVKVKGGKVHADSNFNLRALMGIDKDGNIHIFKVYRKFNRVDRDLFESAEKDYYEQANRMAQQLGLELMHPFGE